MTAKIFKSIFLTAIVVFAASFAVFFFFTYDYYNDRLEEEITREAEVLKNGYDEAEDKDEYLLSLKIDGATVTLIERDGTVIFDTRVENGTALPSHIDREEVREALTVGEGFATRKSDTGNLRMVYCARVAQDGKILRVATEHYSPASILFEIISPALILLSAAVAFAFLVAAQLSRAIVKPINEINLDSPESTRTFKELEPIIKKLASQRYRITKQMNELRKREVEFDSITMNMTEGMVIINSRTAVLSCNKSARRIFGVGDGDLAGGVLSLNPAPTFRSAVAAALSGKNGYDELSVGDKFYTILVTPVFNGARVDGAVIVIIDNTEKEQREALRREFTANVSHELKTPLTSIKGFAELIEGKIADGDDAVRFAANIRKEADRLVSLVGDIIKLNQLDGGEIPFDEEPIPLLECAREVVARLENIAERAGVTVTADGEGVFTSGNRQILEEMLYNLVDNAIKYNKVGGRVEILTKKVQDGVQICISDTGIGIPADKLDRVFERFYRVDKSHSKEIGGTGLGLSIVKHAAAYHKAKISIDSELGVGTQICVNFVV